MGLLRARLVGPVPSSEGIQAEVILIEPNGDEHSVRCLCRSNGSTDIGGDSEVLDYLNTKYGDQSVCGLAREVTLGSTGGAL